MTFGFRANAFLHQMVRTLVGTLVRVGEGKLEPGGCPDHAGGPETAVISQPAPARGLTLERVAYGRRSGTSDRAMKRANFDGVAFPQVALPIGRYARPISHV